MGRIGWIVFVGFVVLCFSYFNPLDFRETRLSRQSMVVFEKAIRQHDGGRGLLVFDGAILLYTQTGKIAPSPLVFPGHLNERGENNVSHLDTRSEIVRILDQRPGVVILDAFANSFPVNRATTDLVLNYVNTRCRLIEIENWRQYYYNNLLTVYGDCR